MGKIALRCDERFESMAPLWGGFGPSKRHDGSLRPTKVLTWTTSCSPNAVGHRFLEIFRTRGRNAMHGMSEKMSEL
jgi:hypothetical protein